jgi:uncharacterized protein
MAVGPKFQFQWNESNRQHVFRHKVTTEEFEQAMFNDPMFIDLEEESGEDRWYALGPTNGMRMLFLVFTYREQISAQSPRGTLPNAFGTGTSKSGESRKQKDGKETSYSVVFIRR